jgi:tRNA threonylcarbamoyl adenosine modification protein (Sua5/YciO/YrdC/YwlC family)
VTSLELAAGALAVGLAVGIPTDTVYGIAVRAASPEAVSLLRRVKHRGESIPYQVLVADLEQAETLAVLEPPAHVLAARFWPGGLTLVLRRREGLGMVLGGDEETIGLRCPAHPLVRKLCTVVGPLAATSANLHREPPLTSAAEIEQAFGPELAAVVDGGRLSGEASTVADLTGDEPRCLRQGAVPWPEVLAALGGRP